MKEVAELCQQNYKKVTMHLKKALIRRLAGVTFIYSYERVTVELMCNSPI